MIEEEPKAKKKPGPKPKLHTLKVSNGRALEHVYPGSVIASEPVGISLSSFLSLKPIEIKHRYSLDLQTGQALQELSDLRRICEQAAMEINNRLKPEEEECFICHSKVPIGTKFTQFVNIKDHKTGTSQNKILCSIPCVQEYNRRYRGRAALVDSGEIAAAV
jgi:hypothetical protein